MSFLSFKDQTVLVTGGSSGIGFGVAQAFAEAGATLHIMSQSSDIVAAAEKLSENSSVLVTAHQCDIQNSEAVKEALASIGQLDVLVANAGVERVTPITDLSSQTEEDFRTIINTNILGTYYVTREAVRYMEQGSNIIITASIWGRTGVAEFSGYVASKHANIGFMRSLARELGPEGIRVNCVCPGWVKTGPAMQSLKEIAEDKQVSEEEALSEITANQCLPGIQEPSDIAGLYLYLASPFASNITGQSINADRGERLS
ncbi:SDR family oxidoreductase [Kordiimonas sp. SCSIO 12603]|uniref:SDR family NAD(P)-dependent oxidoreductase n=1 Tax=Kordiimonas sp. SCSIO 12603 TaxID=2829596 RepID=UPI002103651C|nr:SDR family oxidoreductase [Kordiimonas sp. SCSIO 12603]UTW60350.1 SDR family oxidoreductase [Kordiimonas sp. SCSIO 12603]